MKEMSNSVRIGTLLLMNVVSLGLFAVPEADRAALDEHAVPAHRTVRIASFREVISPAVGTKICPGGIKYRKVKAPKRKVK